MRELEGKYLAIFVAMIVAMIVAGVGFVYKMIEFALTIGGDEVAGFGAVAIGTYLIGMLPLVFFTLWAVASGHFRDIERPKYRMLEIQAELDGWKTAGRKPAGPRLAPAGGRHG